jgi:hypothetical protein
VGVNTAQIKGVSLKKYRKYLDLTEKYRGYGENYRMGFII